MLAALDEDMPLKTSEDKITALYSISQLLLICGLLCAQALGGYRMTDCMVYICILLDALFAVRTWVQRKAGVLPVIAMVLTLAADTLLVLLDRYYIPGVFLFCCVQAIYAVYIHRIYDYRIYDQGMRLCLFAIFVCVLSAFGQVKPLQLLAAFSFSQLLANCLAAYYGAVRCHGPERVSAQLLAAGLLMFLGCDLCVGIRNLPLPEGLHTLAFSLNWIFYVPSQYLIVRSYYLSDV